MARVRPGWGHLPQHLFQEQLEQGVEAASGCLEPRKGHREYLADHGATGSVGRGQVARSLPSRPSTDPAVSART